MTLLAHLSDTHIVEPGSLLLGDIDSAAMLREAVSALLAMPLQPDAVLLTGDLVDSGKPSEYAHLCQLLSPLPMPLILLPGNHDLRSSLRSAVAGPLADSRAAGLQVLHPADRSGLDLQAPLDGVLTIGPLRLVLLDSALAGRPEGALTDAQIAWLDARLAEHPQHPTLVAVHHPPFDSGIRFMDGMSLHQGREGLLRVIAKHPQVERLLCGHLHRCTQQRLAGTLAISAPSTVHQLLLDLRPDGVGALAMEPPGFLLHHWRHGALVTHRVHCGGPVRQQKFEH